MKAPLLALALLLSGCGQRGQTPPQPPLRFSIHQDSGDTFLLDSQSGDVWKYDALNTTFVKIGKSESPARCYNPETKNLEKCTPEWYKKYGASHPSPQKPN